MLDQRRLRISLNLRPPTGDDAGAVVEHAEDFTVAIERDATLPSDRITAWFVEHRANPRLCACGCGKRTDVTRRHYWTGLPEFTSACRHRGMSRRRWALARQLDDYNGEEVARLLEAGRTTINRMLARGELPTPQRSVSRMLLFPRAAVDHLVAVRRRSNVLPPV